MHSHDRTLLARLGFADPDRREPLHDLAAQYLAQTDRALALVQHVTRRFKEPLVWIAERVEPEYHITKGEGQYRTTIGFADLLIDAEIICERHVRSARKEKFEEESKKRRSEERAAWEEWEWRTPWETQLIQHPQLVERWKEHVRKEREEGTTETWLTGGNAQQTQRQVARQLANEFLSSFDNEEAKWLEERMNQPIRESLIQKENTWHDEVSGVPVYGSSRSILVEIKIQPVAVGDLLRQLELYSEYLPGAAMVAVTAFDLSPDNVAMLTRKEVEHVRLGASFEAYCASQSSGNTRAEAVEI